MHYIGGEVEKEGTSSSHHSVPVRPTLEPSTYGFVLAQQATRWYSNGQTRHTANAHITFDDWVRELLLAGTAGQHGTEHILKDWLGRDATAAVDDVFSGKWKVAGTSLFCLPPFAATDGENSRPTANTNTQTD